MFYHKFTKEKSQNRSTRIILVERFCDEQKRRLVYFEAEGNAVLREKLIVACKKGPINVNVENVATEQLGAKRYKVFEIRY